jgi:hypothetical protein
MIEKHLCGGMSMRAMLTMSALCLAVGTAGAQDNRAAPIFSSQLGRFQIVTNARDTFLLDSAASHSVLGFQQGPFVAPIRLSIDTTPLLSEYGLKQTLIGLPSLNASLLTANTCRSFRNRS